MRQLVLRCEQHTPIRIDPQHAAADADHVRILFQLRHLPLKPLRHRHIIRIHPRHQLPTAFLQTIVQRPHDSGAGLVARGRRAKGGADIADQMEDGNGTEDHSRAAGQGVVARREVAGKGLGELRRFARRRVRGDVRLNEVVTPAERHGPA